MDPSGSKAAVLQMLGKNGLTWSNDTTIKNVEKKLKQIPNEAIVKARGELRPKISSWWREPY